MPYDDADLRQYLGNVWHRARIDLDADHWARRYADTLGIDMSLHVVGKLLSQEAGEKTARQMEYPWQPTV